MKEETRLMFDNKLASIQSGVDIVGDMLLEQGDHLGSFLKRRAFELGMVRTALSNSTNAIDAHPAVDEEVQE